MTVQVALRKFTVDEYHRLAETGILSVDEILGWAYILSRTRRLKASSSRSISSRVL